MHKGKKYRVVIIGTGNVAWHLAHGWFEKGVVIAQVYGRQLASAQKLALKVDSHPIDDYAQLVSDADLYLVAVADKAIPEVVSNIITTGVVVHTSGTLGLEVFNSSTSVGIMYPLQTFTKGRTLSLKKVPFFLDYANEEAGQVIHALAQCLSKKLFTITPEEKKILHVAAVFASNFTNHLYGVAADILKEKNLPMSWLKPLVKETQKKAFDMSPKIAQTGPAKRRDMEVMSMHQQLLSSFSHKALYQLISEQISPNTNIHSHGKL